MAEKSPNRNSRDNRFPAAMKMRVAVLIYKAPTEGREQLVERLAVHVGASSRTLWRWLRDFEERGSQAFTKRTRRDKGRSRYFQTHPEVAARVARMWASRWSAHAIHEELWFEMLTPPAYSTVRSYVRKLEQTRPQ